MAEAVTIIIHSKKLMISDCITDSCTKNHTKGQELVESVVGILQWMRKRANVKIRYSKDLKRQDSFATIFMT